MPSHSLKLITLIFGLSAASDLRAYSLFPSQRAAKSSTNEKGWESALDGLGPRLGLGQKGASDDFERGRVVAHCVFSMAADERFETLAIRVFKNSQLGDSLRSAEVLRSDASGVEIERKNYNYVFAKRLRKESAGAFSEVLSAAKLIGLKADSIMFYGIDVNPREALGLAVVLDEADEPLDRFVLLGRKIYRCEGTEDRKQSCNAD